MNASILTTHCIVYDLDLPTLYLQLVYGNTKL